MIEEIAAGRILLAEWAAMLWVAGLSSGLVLEQQTDPSVLQLLVKLEADVNTNAIKLRELEESCTCKASSTPLTPAFMATLNNRLDGCSTDQPVIFDGVELNQGGGYDKRHGTFRAPRNGTYQFSATLSSYPSGSYYVAFVKNSAANKVGYLFADGHTSFWQMQTTSIILHLNAGDDVWMSCLSDSSMHGGTSTTSAGHYHSHFSGFMISED